MIEVSSENGDLLREEEPFVIKTYDVTALAEARCVLECALLGTHCLCPVSDDLCWL